MNHRCVENSVCFQHCVILSRKEKVFHLILNQSLLAKNNVHLSAGVGYKSFELMKPSISTHEHTFEIKKTTSIHEAGLSFFDNSRKILCILSVFNIQNFESFANIPLGFGSLPFSAGLISEALGKSMLFGSNNNDHILKI